MQGEEDMSILCPICTRELEKNEGVCRDCGADLHLYRSLFYAPDLLFNEAQHLLEEEDYCEAYDKLAAAHYLRPSDREILLAMADCARKMKNYRNALEKVMGLYVDSEEPELKLRMEELEKLYREQQENEKVTEEFWIKIRQTLSEEIQKVLQDAVDDLLQGALEARRAGKK